MRYRIALKPSAQKQLEKLPAKQRLRIQAALASLSSDPHGGKKLAGKYKDFWSLKVWPYRIIYYIHKGELLIVIIGVKHRQGVY